MPTEQPSSAPQADAPRPTDDLTAAAVLHDEAMDKPAGGGGLGGASAAVPGDPVGAATRNSPIDVTVPQDAGDAKAAAESRAAAVASAPPEPDTPAAELALPTPTIFRSSP